MNKKDTKKYKVEYTRGTGAGGQHKNKVETCVTITHLPTGMKERCQDTRYKKRNYDMALERLNKRLDQRKKVLAHTQQNKERVETIKNAGVIRTYNYARNEVKDHRSGKTANLKKFLDGSLDLL
jgi:protein subunit release factor A